MNLFLKKLLRLRGLRRRVFFAYKKELKIWGWRDSTGLEVIALHVLIPIRFPVRRDRDDKIIS